MPEKNNEKELQLSQTKYASRLLRYAASMLDALIVTFFGLFLLAPLYFLGALDTKSGPDSLIYLVTIVYSVVLIKLKNATLGKQFFGLEVRMEDGSQVSWLRAILRETVGKILSSIVLMLGFVWILFDKKRQGWHDKLAKTVVIQAKEVGRGKRIFAWIITFGLPLIAILGVLAVVVLVAINPVEQIRKANELEEKSQMMQQQKQKDIDSLYNYSLQTE